MLLKVPSSASVQDATDSESPVAGGLDLLPMAAAAAALDPFDMYDHLAPVDAQFEEDFAEYMWMMNEEEFDKDEMQRLEEEALMEQCLEAMFGADEEQEQREEVEEDVDDDEMQFQADGEAISQELSKLLSLLRVNSEAAALRLQQASSGDASSAFESVSSEELAAVAEHHSQLNPLAEEFVPSESPAAT